MTNLLTRRAALAGATALATATALPAAGAVAATRPSGADPEEAKAAGLLDEALQAHWAWGDAPDLEQPGIEEPTPMQQAAQAREDEAVDQLLDLDSGEPAVWLAQFVYLSVQNYSEGMFQGDAELLDFEAALEEDRFNGSELYRFVCWQIVEQLQACADSPVVAVIEKHRAIARQRKADWKAVAADREAEREAMVARWEAAREAELNEFGQETEAVMREVLRRIDQSELGAQLRAEARLVAQFG